MWAEPSPAVVVIEDGGLIADVDEAALLGTRLTVPAVRRDGTEVDIDLVITGVRFAGRDEFAGVQRERAQLSALKTEFVATVSHELRTPLTSIATFADMLDESLPTAEWTAAVTAIQRNAARMLGVVADLVLLAKLESGQMPRASEPVDPAALVRRFADTPAVRTEVSEGAPVTGDPELLGQLVDAVVGVLLDASVAGADVFVRARPEPDGWLVSASTSAADAASAEWLLSTRVPAVTDAEDPHRTGALALMLARAIAARHGGNLEIALRRPGAHITVRLPFRA